MPIDSGNLALKGLDDLFSTEENREEDEREQRQQIDNLIRGAYGSKIKVFDQTIPRSVRAAEISAVSKSIFQHDPKGKVAEAYRSLTKEVMANAEKQLKRVAERGR